MTGSDADPTLGVVLSRVARRLSDTQLVVMSVLGPLAAVLMFVFLRPAWKLGLLFLAVGAFAGWAISGRQGAVRESVVTAALRRLCAALGVGAMFALGLALLASALGTWIS